MLPATNLMDAGRAFRIERKAQRKTQSDVARAAGLRRETIIRIEAGENVDMITFLKASLALGKGVRLTDVRPAYEDAKELFREN